MNVLVIHPSLNGIGGSERVCLAIIESLKESGYNVLLGTFEKTNWKKVEEYLGDVAKPDKEIVKSRVFGMFAYGELLNFHALSSSIPKNYDIAIVSCYSPWFYCPQSKKTIVYMIPPVGYHKGFKRIYLSAYNFMQHKLLEKVENKVLLTNSLFSTKVIEDVYSLKTKVLYPPVDLKNFHPSNKEELIVSIGRFDPFKRFEVLIKSFVDVKDAKCIIAGSTQKNATVESFSYIKKLRKLINDLNLQDRVELLIDCPLDSLKHILSKSKLYVHCAVFEHFGISVVEGMASGCVPIVHKSGGAYTDIINYDKYGFSFRDTNELADEINLLLQNDGLFKKYSEEAINRSEFFTKEKFKKRMLDVVQLNSY